jgi:hypothetical protein
VQDLPLTAVDADQPQDGLIGYPRLKVVGSGQVDLLSFSMVLCAAVQQPDNRRTMFETELAFFIANQHDLVERHNGKVLVIRGEQIAGVYNSPLEAFVEAQKQFQPGTFMIQPCAPGPEAYTVTIHN